MLDSFEPGSAAPQHLKRTADWVKKLRPDADKALLVAALCHDIERGISDEKGKLTVPLENITGDNYLKSHQERSGRIMRDFLVQAGADAGFADRVYHLIEKHEVGGDDDQNLLKDADSISFFENNIDLFLEKVIHIIGREEMIQKFQWMYERITSKEAQAFVLPFYLKAMERVDQV